MTDQIVKLTGTKVGMSEAYVAGVRRAVTKIQLDGGEAVPGTVVLIRGKSKGKGFAGVVKRWGFAGGPRTHGQSDRHRAPGSIGQGTTPGRVRKLKKMAGRMGGEGKAVKNSLVVSVSGQSIWVTGPVPGGKNAPLTLTLTGTRELKDVIVPTMPIAPAAVESAAPAAESKVEEKNEN